MTLESISQKVSEKPLTADDIFFSYCSPTRSKAADACIPYHLDIDLIERCTGGCKYCWNSSDPFRKGIIPKEVIFRLINEAVGLGTRQILLTGGEALLHPDIFEIADYAGQKGVKCALFTSGLPLTKNMARQIAQQSNLQDVAINIDTLDEKVFGKLHDNPKILQKKKEGYMNLLEAGIPPSRIFPCLLLTKPSMETLEETIDWFIDEMGAEFVFLPTFIPWGFGQQFPQWEPSRSDIKRAMGYRAKRLSSNWLRIATLDCNMIHCKIKCYITTAGEVLPCNYLIGMSAGNIYEKSFIDIHEANKERLHFKGFEIKGKCGECENNDVCFGCRAKALKYLGDPHASDPKCWNNPDAPEYCYQLGPL